MKPFNHNFIAYDQFNDPGSEWESLHREEKTFSRTTTVSALVNADRSIIWALLTNAADFSRWNSTVVSIEGDIREGREDPPEKHPRP